MTHTAASSPGPTIYSILGAISFCHLLNDLMQALLPAIYPIIKGGFDLSFVQIGSLTLTYQVTASLLQPLIGRYTDRNPTPYLLPVGMAFSMTGMFVLALTPTYIGLLLGAAMLGAGSSIFHPEASRIAHVAAGGAHGLAQSIFQVGGSVGSSLGPLLAAFFIVPRGHESLSCVALLALAGIAVLTMIASRSEKHVPARRDRASFTHTPDFSAKQIKLALAVLIALIFSKFFYLASFTSYYTFYLVSHFNVAVESAQVYLFMFLAASAAGGFIGGPIGDRVGRKKVIWGSILGILPFTLALPYMGLDATIGLSLLIGFILSSAFSAIVVYAHELLPGRVGMVSGLFFGLAFGMGGVGSAMLGLLADWTSIEFVYKICSFLPLIGLLTIFLPTRPRPN